MKWIENGFWFHDEKFTIIGLELTYSKEKIEAILSGIDVHVKATLRYQLVFDFAFMAGVYPGIVALCMIAREKVASLSFKKIFFVFAVLQLAAWGCDVAENSFLFKWIRYPKIGSDFQLYHIIVWLKWILALSGAILSIPFALRNSKRANG